MWFLKGFQILSIAIGIILAGFCNSAFAALGGPSVYRVSPWTDGSVILLTSLGSIFPAINESHLIHPRCPCGIGEVNALDRHVIGNESHAAEVISDLTLGLSTSAPVLLDVYDQGFNHVLVEDLTIYAEVLSVSGAFVTLAKYTVQRPIPRVYAGQASSQDAANYGSFYSGHVDLTTAALSAAAMTMDLRYHWGAWPWIATAALGLSVAAERVLAGRHFYTDVAMGAAAGTLCGITIPLLHRLDSPKQSVTVSNAGYTGLELGWSRYF